MISYKPFQKLLIDKGIKKKEMVKKVGISWATMAKFNKNEYVSLEIIDRLCYALHCQPGELIEHIPDKKKKNGESN